MSEAKNAADSKAEALEGARSAHPSNPPSGPSLLSKRVMLKKVGDLSFTTIWAWMREGKFPRARKVGSRSMWLASEIDDWISSRPLTPLKGDDARTA